MGAPLPHTQPGRLERLRAGLESAGCAGAVLVGEDHAAHLCGYSRYLSGLVAVVIDGDGRRLLVVPAFEAAAAEEVGHADVVVAYGPDHFLDFSPLPTLAGACAELLPAGRIGVAAGSASISVAVGQAARAETIDIARLVETVRRVKDADELERLADSYVLTLVGQDAVVATARAGVTEIELFSAAQAAAQNASGNPIEFISGIGAGISSAGVAPPVCVPGRRALGHGEPVLSDVAVRHRGYWGDTTRTTVLGTNSEAQSVIDEMTEILRETATHLLPGTSINELHAFMSQRILRRFPEGVFPHHGGHGLGVGVGEDPQIIPSEDSTIETGMVFAVEPGVYFSGRFGVRVEDMFVVSDQGGRLISDFAAPR
jgi:Xaa-Pro aminopeptidase